MIKYVTKTVPQCKKCGQLILKHSLSKSCCLTGYTPNKNLCPDCNAAQSVITRLQKGENIRAEEYAILPRYLVFDETNVMEGYWAEEFKKAVAAIPRICKF
ncbi:hypothetical protein bpr_II042 (plasmid) [Butyrivibrio proteoclasticus B316]|uniref:Uncharacterized protein n=1 Tax=Butyrivibrio proteoclasticus (strain ATCC 51982 / DSM 14932 / B316) TaxID=515622 RepID=E0S3K0_BUTPB|nr:hypothetical protein [Butyrivibrio proteoclasticus]ADL35982.1 hypothetical protein bpr_II042 [Butyrivibrio proteoclasticus B316]